MATIDIGKLAFTHKGDYAGGTAYVANDVVYYNGSAYIAKTSTTGNLPTSTAHWDVFAAGSGGIWNSGLSLGTAGQVVKVNSGASALEFGTLSSDFVKITSQESDSFGANNFSLQNCFDDSTYKGYVLYISYNMGGSNGTRLIARYLDASNNELGTSGDQYKRAGGQAYSRTNDNESTMSAWNDASGRNDFDVFNWDVVNSNSYMNFATVTFDRNLNRASTVYPTALIENGGVDASSPAYFFRSHGTMTYVGGTNVTGFKFFTANNNNIGRLSLQLYGRK